VLISLCGAERKGALLLAACPPGSDQAPPFMKAGSQYWRRLLS
jgi:hypothetical protein